MDEFKLKNIKEYEAAVTIVELLFDAPRGTDEADVCLTLSYMVEAYEEEHYSV
jgi:antitoxin component HigA of HigAB toxin-antitoxin module